MIEQPGPGDWVLLYEPHRTQIRWRLSGLGRIEEVLHIECGPEPERAEHLFYILAPAVTLQRHVGTYGTKWRASETRPITSREDLAPLFSFEEKRVRELALRAVAELEGT